MEDAIRAHAAIGEGLRAIAEGVGERIAAFVCDRQYLLILHEVELDGAGDVGDRIALDITADPDVASFTQDAQQAKAVGLLTSDDLTGIFDLTPLNSLLSAAGDSAVSAG